MKKIKLGISSCLLGQRVRYNGEHKLEPYLKYRLGKYINWRPVCPECEAGLPVPREAMELYGSFNAPRLLGVQTQTDYTHFIQQFITKRIAQLKEERLWGFVFKSKSPSCGLKGVSISSGCLLNYFKGEGLFAKAWRRLCPFLPLTDEKSLKDSLGRESFIIGLAVLADWQKTLTLKKSAQALALFHRKHKLILQACDLKTWQVLHKLPRWAKSMARWPFYEAYQQKLLVALKKGLAPERHQRVLSFIRNYLKRLLQPQERQRLTKTIKLYSQGKASLKDLSQLIKAYAQKYHRRWLLSQSYLKIPTQEWAQAWEIP